MKGTAEVAGGGASVDAHAAEPVGTRGGEGATANPSQYGDLEVSQSDLAKIGDHALTLYNDLWSKGRSAAPSSDKAAGDLLKQGFALGGGLQHVSARRDEKPSSVRDACAPIANHMQVNKKLHADASKGGQRDPIAHPMGMYAATNGNFGASLFFQCSAKDTKGLTRYVKASIFSSGDQLEGNSTSNGRMTILNSVSATSQHN